MKTIAFRSVPPAPSEWRRRLIDQDKLADPVHLADPRAFKHAPLPIEHPGAEQLGHDIDDAGPAQSHRRPATDGLELDPVFVQTQSFNGAEGGAHAVLDMGAFERRSGGAGGTGQDAFIRQTDLGVRADVDGQRDSALLFDVGGQQHGHVVRADIPGHIGQQMYVGSGRELQAKFACLHIEGRCHGRHVGSQGELPDGQAQKEMVHRRVAHDDHIDDLGGFGFDVRAQLGGHLIGGSDDQLAQKRAVAVFLLGKGDA